MVEHYFIDDRKIIVDFRISVLIDTVNDCFTTSIPNNLPVRSAFSPTPLDHVFLQCQAAAQYLKFCSIFGTGVHCKLILLLIQYSEALGAARSTVIDSIDIDTEAGDGI